MPVQGALFEVCGLCRPVQVIMPVEGAPIEVSGLCRPIQVNVPVQGAPIQVSGLYSTIPLVWHRACGGCSHSAKFTCVQRPASHSLLQF